MKTSKRKTPGLKASKFIALPDSEKERIYQEIDSMTEEQIQAEFKPLNAKHRAGGSGFRKRSVAGVHNWETACRRFRSALKNHR